ncbi:copper amine oxidase N-terminal domain-containing protein [Lysinibacillus fusiformis]|uniref:copper amine oxidase N-terminal domain-containing protein n=1 Tax=Lysinibacillus fusiformis TaxID=28031 RepID=UPI001E4205F5|nr:copper amine oxidase N-terminal domain-containing protein [Lysinibacillus fusiformis]MCE4042548.1 copper amine oxidase N-terminal domain-containing protein [Lysinibacillus fusiformis]
MVNLSNWIYIHSWTDIIFSFLSVPLHHLDFPIVNAKTKMTTVQNKNGDYLKITVNSHSSSNNGQDVQMEVPAQNREGRILVPLRFVSESLGYDIYFEPIRQFVFIHAKDYSFDSSILEQEDLQAARKAAIALPIKVDFKTLGTSDGHRLHSYTFPIGRADVYYLLDAMFTFVEIKKGQALAIGQLFRERRVPSIAVGNISPNISLDTDPIMELYNHGNVLFTEYEDNTAKASYTEQGWIFYRKENEDGHLFRPHTKAS